MEVRTATSWFPLYLTFLHFVGFCCGSSDSCSSLPFIEHGTLRRLPGTTVKVKVECEPSYMFYSEKKPGQTNPFIYCRRGRWTEPNPRCELRPNHCEAPQQIENGKILQHLTDYPSETEISYECNEGYVLRGPSERTCLSNGQSFEWSDVEPKCEEYDPTVIGNVAKYLDKQFVNKMESYASSDVARMIGYDVEFEGLDLILLFDKSSSIHGEDFNQGIEFAKFLVERFNVSNGSKNKVGGTRIGVYTFGNKPVPEIKLDSADISSTLKAKQKMDTIKCALMCDGGTNLVDALALIAVVFRTEGRKKAKKALFITSDGTPTAGDSKNPIEYYIDKITEQDVEIFAVGIGNDIDVELLRTWANKPPEDHVFMLNEFKDFTDIVKIIREKQPPPPPPPLEECGYMSERVQERYTNDSGQVKAGAWPWLAAVIKANSSTGGTTFVCSGVLICQQWVVTPAHCLYSDGQLLKPENIYVILGEDDLSKDNGHEQYFYASAVIPHPEFDIRKLNNVDIGLIKLYSNANLNDYVRTACIPEEKGERHLSAETESEGITVGWLTTSEDSNRLSYGGTASMNASQAQFKLYGTESCENFKPKQLFCEDMFIAGNVGLAAHKCTGEIGSSFHRTDSKGRHLTLGLSVYSTGCSLDDKVMIYVSLENHLDWIKRQTKSCTRNHRTQYLN